MTPVSELNVEIFADGADIDGISEMAANPLIKGFTTNPTLMRRAGISDYESFARDVLEVVTELPVSFEVFADDFDEMRVGNAAIERLLIPAMGQPSRIRDDQMDHVNPVLRQVGTGIVGVGHRKRRQCLFNLRTGRAIPGMACLCHHLGTFFTCQSGAGTG